MTAGADPAVVGGRYELGALLGTGASAVVRRASDRVSGRTFAVKLFHAGASAHDRRRQQREMRALATLHHPGLVALHDGGVEDGRPFIVTDLVEGPTLAERLEAGPLDPDEVLAHRRPAGRRAGPRAPRRDRAPRPQARQRAARCGRPAAGRLRDRPRARRHRGDRHRVRRRHGRLPRAGAGARRVGRARGRRLRPRPGAPRVADRAAGVPRGAGGVGDRAAAPATGHPDRPARSPWTPRCGR